ncbi:UDP-sugar pyrophosphorylase 1 [Vigna radiata var. radiata]|uniref:UTP-monosaccharide-1-phosphate uridylyltransferase n=1 Tax=Vigna radiata var. radiata TaxID=3916 RepID=A0A1S3U7T0_VIGRR|nr:UDP-sugar pyrophosphorylase 1 [Vigna radiata var. radiata]
MATSLGENLNILSTQQQELVKMLLENGQDHLFRDWPPPGVEDDHKKAFFDQLTLLDSSYPGGLESYIKNAKRLLADSKAGKNPYDGFTPSVPTGETLTFGDENYINFEETGVREARKAAFVLVAGGLGERLGYSGIKVALPAETTTGTCFIQHYIESILALQEASSQGESQTKIPLVIMTSDDTHGRTLELLESNSYFGMQPTQVTLLKQEKVACLEDNDARLALEPQNKYKIQTKPHGHGDVHSLLYSSGILKVWYDAGLKWVLFFQDTNGLLFKAIPAALGVSASKQYHVNSLAVPRKAKEAIGGITRLTHSDGRSMVINVEYNQLDPLLRASGYPEGDVNCETGFSPFPGNINQLILGLGPYIEELSKTGGAIQEFVNPKYKDASKTSFKSSTRLECMMQDYPKTLSPSARVGFTVMETWLAYAPVKNNAEDAAKVPKGNPYHSATSGEMAIYRANSIILKKAGVQVAEPVVQVFNGQEVEVWPRVTWKPKWGLTFSRIKSKVSGNCSVSQRSTLAIKGQNIFIENLSLDGALIIDAVDDAEVNVSGSVQNKGWILETVDYKDTTEPEVLRIRGFKFNKTEQLETKYSEPGKFHLKA